MVMANRSIRTWTNGSLRIGTIRSIPRCINASRIIVFVLSLWSFAASYHAGWA